MRVGRLCMSIRRSLVNPSLRYYSQGSLPHLLLKDRKVLYWILKPDQPYKISSHTKMQIFIVTCLLMTMISGVLSKCPYGCVDVRMPSLALSPMANISETKPLPVGQCYFSGTHLEKVCDCIPNGGKCFQPSLRFPVVFTSVSRHLWLSQAKSRH